jgi:hypothetical protein
MPVQEKEEELRGDRTKAGKEGVDGKWKRRERKQRRVGGGRGWSETICREEEQGREREKGKKGKKARIKGREGK